MVKIITNLQANKKMLLYCGLSLLLLISAGYFGRGWLRVSVFPRLYALRYKNHVHGVTAETYYSLGNPFAFLGQDNLNHEPTSCVLEGARSFRTSITCYRSLSGTKDLVTTTDYADYQQWVTALSKELVNQGWAVDQEFSTVNGQPIDEASAAKLDAVDNMYIYYEKHTKDVICSLNIFYGPIDSTTSALSSYFSCSSTNYYFGNPN